MSCKGADRSVTDDGHHPSAFSPKAESAYFLSTSVMANRKQQG